jgi:tripartite-type tricarboxylate transporter receptor subunit TctC
MKEARMVPTFSRRCCLALVAAAAVAPGVLPLAARAADPYPSHPVKIIVPYSPGGGTDVVTRALAQKLSDTLGQPFVVENRPGADATIGPALAAKAAADGYSLLATSGVSFLITRSSMKDLPYDPMKDFAPVALFASVPMVLVGAPKLPAQDAKGLVALAKSSSKSLDYAGTDQMVFLATEQLAQGTGVKMQHIPYKGAGPALSDVLGGHVSVMLASINSVIPHIKEGRVKAYAVTTSTRAAALPDVPTVAETILPGYELTAWFGMFAPANAPRDVVDKLANAIGAALKSPEMKKQLDAMGADPTFLAPGAFQAFLVKEDERWTRAFKASGLTPN